MAWCRQNLVIPRASRRSCLEDTGFRPDIAVPLLAKCLCKLYHSLEIDADELRDSRKVKRPSVRSSACLHTGSFLHSVPLQAKGSLELESLSSAKLFCQSQEMIANFLQVDADDGKHALEKEL